MAQSSLYQFDSYRRSLRADVVRCEKTEDGYEAVLSDTVLYPEGGGQPADKGTVDGLEVRGLRRAEDGAILHLLEGPVTGRVEVAVDWPRRYEHMQQHTAQHLITATALNRFGLRTTAFHLGTERSDIELACPDLSQELRAQIEEQVNRHVREGRAVTARVVDPTELPDLGVRSRGLPEGFSGPVRLVEIEGVDLNTCGGTHVRNLGELQAVKLLQTERLRGGTRLYFTAGGRTLALVEGLLDREKLLTALLSIRPEDHAARVEALLAELRLKEKERKNLSRRAAALIGEALAQQGGAAAHHEAEGSPDFLLQVCEAARRIDPRFRGILTAGGDSGVFLIAAPPEILDRIGRKAAELLAGRGGGRGGLLQGRYTRLEGRDAVLRLL